MSTSPPIARLGRLADELDLEVFESLEAELFAKAVHARDRNVGARGKYLNGKPAHILAHGEGRLPKLLLGGGEAFALRDLRLISIWLLCVCVAINQS